MPLFDVFLYLSPEESAYIRKQAARTRRAPGEVLRSVITYCTADALEARLGSSQWPLPTYAEMLFQR